MMQIDYRLFTDITSQNMRFYVANAIGAKNDPLCEQLNMASAAAIFYSWLDIAETLPADSVKSDMVELKAIIQAVNPDWPPTEESVNALRNEVISMLKR